jgi:hypothetical protein
VCSNGANENKNDRKPYVAIKNGQYRDTGNIGHKTQNENTTKSQKHNTDNWKDEQHEHHRIKHILFPQNIKKLRLWTSYENN